MNRTFSKDTICFYLVALGAGMAAIAAMSVSAIWRATGGVAAGLAIMLPAFVLACMGYSHPSPLNKVRCAGMFGVTVTLGVCFLVMFVVVDLAGVVPALRNAEGAFKPNGMGVVMLIYMSMGAMGLVLTAIRTTMQATGKSMRDLERRLQVQSEATESQQLEQIEPRKVDENLVMSKADQEVRMSRMSIVPAPAEGAGRAGAAAEPRERSVPRKKPTAQPTEPTPSKPTTPSVETVESILAEEEQVESAPVRSIFDAPAEEAVEESDDSTEAVIYADNDDVDDTPVQEVEMAQATLRADADLRTEVATHRPRQKEADGNNDWYTDFDYSGNEDRPDNDGNA